TSTSSSVPRLAAKSEPTAPQPITAILMPSRGPLPRDTGKAGIPCKGEPLGSPESPSPGSARAGSCGFPGLHEPVHGGVQRHRDSVLGRLADKGAGDEVDLGGPA